MIEEHYKTHFKRLVKKYTRPAGTEWDAEDVVQTAYERAMKYHVPGVIEDFDAWFAVLLRNALIDHLNKGRGLSQDEFDEFDHEAVPTIGHHVLVQTLETLIGVEPEDNRPILELHFLKGYSAREIYEHNKFSYPNTRKIIQRFRDKLKKEISRE